MIKIATILGFIFIIIITLFIFKQKSLNKLLIKRRVAQYSLLVAMSRFLPFIFSLIIIAVTGEREKGMALGFWIPLLLINIVFAFIRIKGKAILNITFGIIVTLLTIGIIYFISNQGVLNNPKIREHDQYGIITLISLFSLVSIINWEVIDKIYKKYVC